VTPAQRSGWRILFHPVFDRRYNALRDEVSELRRRLGQDEFNRHSTVKLFAAVYELVFETIPRNPNARRFMLEHELAKFRRAKKLGLPPRYRLFWVFSSREKVIVFLYLNDESTLRKEGARSDVYEIFRRLVREGAIGADYQTNREHWLRANASPLLD